MFSKFKKNILAGSVAIATTAMAGTVSAGAMVALLLPENVNPRWETQDAAAFVRTMGELAPDVKVEVFNANNDTSTQQRQAEQALTQGAKVLIVIPIDGESSAIIADNAAEEGVPTIAYDRMINSMNTTFWVQADLEGMGFDQATHIINNTKSGDTLVMLKGSPTDPNAAVIHNGQLRALTPLYESGERIMGYENWTQGWDPAIARRSMDQALTQLNNNGRPDRKIRASAPLSDEFIQYEFNAQNITEFTAFRIKIMMSGTNAADPPKFRSIRAIAYT